MMFVKSSYVSIHTMLTSNHT